GWMRVRFLRDTGVLLSGVGEAFEVADGRWLVGAPPLGVVPPGGEVGPGDTSGVQEREPGRSEDFELVGSCHAPERPLAVDTDRWRLGRCDAEFGPGFEDREAGAPAARVVVGAGLADRVDRAVPSEASRAVVDRESLSDVRVVFLYFEVVHPERGWNVVPSCYLVAVQRTCNVCGAGFKAPESWVRAGRAKYCSRACYTVKQRTNPHGGRGAKARPRI